MKANKKLHIILGMLSLVLSHQVFAKQQENPPRNPIDSLILFGIDLPFLRQQGQNNLPPIPQEDPPQYSTPTNTTFEPLNSTFDKPAVEFKPLQPDLSQLNALMHDSSQLGEISLSPIAGLYQVVIANEVYYLSQDGRYLFEGNLLDLSAKQNLSDIRRNQIRSQLLAELQETDLISFHKSKPKHQVTVFIDIDCPYCRVVYENVAHYNQLGISMHFAPFPRNGLYSSAHAQLSTIWCAADRKQAMQQANLGLLLPMANCEYAIKKPHLIGIKMGITTTPTFVLENGSLIQGYVAPQNLVRLLSESKK